MGKLLEGKVAVIYGGGGAIGGGVARTFAREGARVFLAGRSSDTLEAVAKEITASGGLADIAVVDALDQTAVGRQGRDAVGKAGRLEVSFNLLHPGPGPGDPMVGRATEG